MPARPLQGVVQSPEGEAAIQQDGVEMLSQPCRRTRLAPKLIMHLRAWRIEGDSLLASSWLEMRNFTEASDRPPTTGIQRIE